MTTYGNVTPPQVLRSGIGPANFSAVLTGLTPVASYHFRAVAPNSLGTFFGADFRPLRVVGAFGLCNLTQATIVFDQFVSGGSQSIFSYSMLGPGYPFPEVTAAVRNADNLSVTLTTSLQYQNDFYVVRVHGVRDLMGNEVVPGSAVSFQSCVVGHPTPEIELVQLGTNIADGGSSQQFLVAGSTAQSRVFTVRNFGPAELTGLTITVDGPDASMF